MIRVLVPSITLGQNRRLEIPKPGYILLYHNGFHWWCNGINVKLRSKQTKVNLRLKPLTAPKILFQHTTQDHVQSSNNDIN